MNDRHNNPAQETGVPADVADIAAMLDAMGAADRASMPRGVAEGAGIASFAVLLHPEGADAAAQAAAIAAAAEADRASVPIGLEQRVFEASRMELVAAAPGLRLTGEGPLPMRRAMRPVWWQRSAARAAAAVAIIGAGAAVFVSMRGSEPPAVDPDVSVIAASFDSEMERFFDLLESTPSAGSTETGLGEDHSITDELLEWESL